MRLSDKKNNAPIPYRDSKLTRLLQPALEGDSKVSIICNISPCSDAYDETLSTLKFAQRAKKIKQTIVKNDSNDSKALLVKYEREISELQIKLREMESKLAQEEKNATDMVVSNRMLKLQEAKEQADAKLDRILQEKLQLAEDLERLKSFIIHSEDVKPTKILMTEEKKKNDTENVRGLSRPHTLIYKSPLKLENEFKEFDLREELKDFDVEKNESLLIAGVDDIETILEEPNSKRSFVGGEIGPSQGECLKIIDEQAKQIEELMKFIEMNQRKKEEDDEKDRIIAQLKEVIREKDDEIEEIRDELKLCRNNLTKMQIAFRKKKSENGV